MSTLRFTMKGLGHERLGHYLQAWQRCVILAYPPPLVYAFIFEFPSPAQIDVAVAECIEDTFAAGYTEVKLHSN